MQIFEEIAAIDPALRGAVLTVGNFDGVHLGHQRILRTARALAHVSSAAVIAMTFEPHPVELLRPAEAPRRLTLFEEKARQLSHAGADAIVKLKTTWDLLSLDAESFVRDVLVRHIHPSYIVEGPNFGFGKGRKGSVDTLRQLSPRSGFQVHVVEPFQVHVPGDAESIRVSSTAVRAYLMAGDVRRATACLGRPYALLGSVVHGAGAGKGLGFPTLNLDVGDQLIPAEGVYAGMASVNERSHAAAISIGTRPTMGGLSVVVEAFLLDAEGDFYDQSVRLEFMEFIRGQERFSDVGALRRQIGWDVDQIRAYLKGQGLAS